MLCGRPPFKGESAVSVAYQHVSEAVIPPSQFDPSISAELDEVVMRGLAKDRDERFQTAEEFREHLVAAANGTPIAKPVVAPVATTTTAWSLDGGDSSAAASTAASTTDVAEDDFEALLNAAGGSDTTVIKPVPAAEEILAEEKKSSFFDKFKSNDSPADVQWDDLRTPATNPFSTLGVELPTNTGSSPAPLLDGLNSPSKSLVVTVASAASVVLIGLVIWLVSFGNFSLNIQPGGGIAVVDVVGKTYTDGYSALTAQGLLVSKVAEPNATIPADQIIRTDPIAGTTVGDRQMITVYVSSGASVVKVPSLTGLTEAEAAGVLASFKLTLGTITQGPSANVAAGKVIETLPALNTDIAEGSAVNLIISNGKVMVPDVRNLNISEARAAMSAPSVGLPVSIATREECVGAQGTIVVDQSVLPGLAAQGSAVILYVGCVE
jgi:serine/threonine-protein kinase